MRHQGNPDNLFKFNITITLTVGFVSLLASALLIGIYAGSKNNQNTKDILNFTVATLVASATITGTFYVGQSIRQSAESQELDRKLTAEAQKVDRTLMYIQRWNESHYSSSFKKAGYQVYILTKNQPASQKGRIIGEKIEKNDDLSMDVTALLNFLEEMAICVNRGMIVDWSVFFGQSL
jgi:hypothetical protein